MYSLRNVLKQTPTAITAALTSILTILAAAEASPFSDKTNTAIVGIVAIILSLVYVAPLTSSNAKLEQVQQAADQALAAGVELGARVAPRPPVKRPAKKAG